MRILYVLQDFPYPPINGMRWKTFNLLNYMVERHECHILSFGDEEAALSSEPWRDSFRDLRVVGVFPQAHGCNLALKRAWQIAKGNPVSLARWCDAGFGRALRQTISRYSYDLAHFDMINMAQYQQLLPAIPSVLSTNDAISRAYSRSLATTIVSRIRRAYAKQMIAKYEHRTLPRMDSVHVVSELDAEYYRSEIPGIRIETIGMAVSHEILDYPLLHPTQAERARVVFTGDLSSGGIAKGLLEFLDKSFPAVRSKVPNVEMIVLGRNASAKVQARIECVPNIQFVPWATDYLRELSSAEIIIFPDQSGTGIKTRVLQSMALGRPVVGSSLVFEGIAVRDGVDCYVCDTSDTLSLRVISLLENADLRKSMGLAARQVVVERYTEKEIGLQWEQLYERVVAEGKQKTGRWHKSPRVLLGGGS